MSLLTILRYPDPRLHKVAKPVTVFDAQLKRLTEDMAETMYEAPGIGLAASQVDVHEQIVVIDTSDTRSDLRVFINPEIVWASDDRQVYEEGCLSVPGIYDGVERCWPQLGFSEVSGCHVASETAEGLDLMTPLTEPLHQDLFRCHGGRG